MLTRRSQQWLLFLLALLAVAPRKSCAQFGNIPDDSYYPAVEQLYTGEYRRASRSMASEVRGAIKTAQARWVDSIAYHARLGETYYQMGQNGPALEQFDTAAQLLLAYPDWMLRVKFTVGPRPATNTQRWLAPWGKSPRPVNFGATPRTFLVSQGNIFNNRAVEQGGVVQQAQFWKVNVVEIIRTSAIAIHRRNQILGPLATTDKLSRDLADRFSRGGLTVANHWSNGWIELLSGVAQAGVGKTEEALGALSRAVLLDGQFDHELTGFAFLVQGEIALEAGNLQAAANLFAEAGYAAYAYSDFYVLDEALRQGFTTHVSQGAEGVYPPLPVVATWSQRDNLAHLAVAAQLGVADSLAASRQTQGASAALSAVNSRSRDVLAGRLGAQALRLQGLLAYQQGDRAGGDVPAAKAIARQRDISLGNFQLGLTSARYDSGALSPRQTVGVLQKLLADPTPIDWTRDPLEEIAVLSTDHTAELDRYFIASVERREILPAIEISELAKRRRFGRTDPFGGRLVGLRLLLTTPDEYLGETDRVQRQAMLGRQPEFVELATEAANITATLAGDASLLAEPKLSGAQMDSLKSLGKLSAQQEVLLRQIALQRQPAPLLFPPDVPAADIQKRIRPGQAVIIFHEAGEKMFGFLLVRDDYHTWELGPTRELRQGVVEFLRGIGNYTRTRTLDHDEVAGEAWRTLATELGDAVLGQSRLDLTQTKELIVVPDGLLWHVPLESLLVADSRGPQLVADQTPVRCVPTAGLAFANGPPIRPVKRSVVVLPTVSGPQETERTEARWERLSTALTEPVRLSSALISPTPVALATVNQLVSTSDSELNPGAALTLDVAGLDKGAAGSIAAWMELPAGAPDRMILAGVHTAAENGLKGSRRARGELLRDGEELFLASCGLLASGVRTALISRWTTAGQTADDLVREFALEMANLPPSEAWRRSLLLARAATLDPASEPRLRPLAANDDPPPASHPLFWAGYLLVDNSPQAVEEGEEAPVKEDAEKKEKADEDDDAKPAPPPVL